MSSAATPSSRLAARLRTLPHDELAELAAQLSAESATANRAADAALAKHRPLAAWVVNEVLLSPDLAPQLLGWLELRHGAAAAVCSAWRHRA